MSVAIVGIGCRFPGADNPDELWRLLRNGENHVIEIPADRMNMDHYYHADKNQRGKTHTRKAGIIPNVLEWDNEMFGVNEIEAERMDPQHKLSLEVCYQALQDAGFTMEDVKNTNTAVFMGSMYNDYTGLSGHGVEFINNYNTSGVSNCMLANRLSYFFDLKGPSVQLDTACSTGLQAVHFGIQSILTGESDMAICGGTNVILSPSPMVGLSKSKMSSTIGQCQAFSENADGYVRGEGSGIVILKDFEKAKRDGDKIYGTITTMVNSDGRATTPITAPSQEMQARLINQTLRKAEIDAENIQFVEMHGTGTPVGDPIEVSSVGSTYGQARLSKAMEPCLIGSIKTNIGHLESASGIAGLLKVLLMMKHKEFAPGILFGKVNKALNLAGNGLRLVTEPESWSAQKIGDESVRVGAVNSFGFGGSNVHAVVRSYEELFDKCSCIAKYNSGAPKIVMFTGKNQIATKASMLDTFKYIQNHTDVCLDCISTTSLHHRTLLKHRKALLVQDMDDLEHQLKATVEEKSFGRQVKENKEKPNIVFVFSGMGTQWIDMGRTFFNTEPVYKATIMRLKKIFRTHDNFDLDGCLSGKYNMENPKYAQPALFACQAALFHLWVSKGIVPSQVIGHSVGEVAAAYASGNLSLETASYLIYQRGVAVSKSVANEVWEYSKKKGFAMMAVGNIAVSDVERLIKPYKTLTIAAYNSTTSFTLSGSHEEICQIQVAIRQEHSSARVKILEINLACHSSYMDPVLKGFNDALQNKLEQRKAPAPFKMISTVTGLETVDECLVSAKYWERNVRAPVKFADAVEKTVDGMMTNVFIEIAPKPALGKYIKEILNGVSYEYLSSIDVNDNRIFYSNLLHAYVLGLFCKKKFPEILEVFSICENKQVFRKRTNVPRCIPIRKYLYQESQLGSDIRFGTLNQSKTKSLVKRPIGYAQDKKMSTYLCDITLENTPYVYEHLLGGQPVVPGAMYLDLAVTSLKMGAESADRDLTPIHVRITFNELFLASKKRAEQLQIVLQPVIDNPNLFQFDIINEETLHAFGRVHVMEQASGKARIILPQAKSFAYHMDSVKFYEMLKSIGFSYGNSLMAIRQVSFDESEALIQLEIPPRTDLSSSAIHTIIGDSLLQGAGLIFSYYFSTFTKEVQVMPYGIQDVVIYGAMVRNPQILVRKRENINDCFITDAVICNHDGVIIAEFRGITHGIVGQYENFDVERYRYASKWLPIVTNREHLNVLECLKDKKILLLTDSASQVPIEEYMPELTRVYVTDEMIEAIQDDVKNIDEVIGVELSKYQSIMIQLGCIRQSYNDICKISGKSMNDAIVNKSTFVMFIVKALKINKDTSVFVLIKGVHELLEKRKIAHDPIQTFIGTSLLGLCRGIQKEQSSFGLYVADFTQEDEFELQSFCLELCNGPRYLELAFENEKVKYGTIVSAEMNSSSMRKTKQTTGNLQILTQNMQEKFVVETTNSMLDTTHKLQSTLLTTNQNLRENFDWSSNVLAQDSIVRDSSGNQIHICQPHEVKSSVFLNYSENSLPFTKFPCSYPVLSYWIILWHTMRKLQPNTKIGFIRYDVPQLWELIAQVVAPLLDISISNTEEASTVLLVSSNPVSDLRKLDLKARKVYVIDESFNGIQTSFKRCTNVVCWERTLTSWSPDRISEAIRNFEGWLETVDKTTLEKSVALINERMIKSTVQRVRVEDVNKMNISREESLLVDFAESQEDFEIYVNSPHHLFKPNGLYVVFGGRKGLGWETIKWLAMNGAKYIGVIARSKPLEDKINAGNVLKEKFNCKIYDAQADTTDFANLEAALSQLKQMSACEIKGIFYGSAVIADAIIPNMTRESFQEVLGPKVAGAWNVYLLTRDVELDMFLMYSSIASSFGNAGQSNYCTGNAFMDGLAAYRNAKHGVGQSLCLGALNFGIAVESATTKEKLRALGFIPISVQEIQAILNDALMTNRHLMTYARFAWKPWYRNALYMPEIMQRQYKILLQERCHYCNDTSVSRAYIKGQTNDYVTKVVKVILLSGDEELDSEKTLASLGADSQDRQQIYNILLEDVGFGESDLTLMELSSCTLNELITKINSIQAAN